MPITQFRMNGWNADVDAAMLPDDQWSDVSEMLHRDGVYTRAGGVFDHGSTTPSASFLMNFTGPDIASINKLDNYWLIGGLDTTAKVFLRSANYDATAEITLAGFNASNRPDDWTGGIINGFPVLTVDTAKDNLATSDIQFWDRTGSAGPYAPAALQSLPGQRSNYRVRSIVVHRNHIFGLSTISTANGHVPEEVIWSDAAPVGNIPTGGWVPAAGNEAGDVRLGDSPGEVIDGLSFGNRLLLYKHSAAYSAEYIGGNAVFAFRKLSDEVGVIGRHCAVNVGHRQFLFTPYDIVEFNGTQFRSICDGTIRRKLFDLVYAANVRTWACFLTYNPIYGEVWAVIPETSSETGTEIFVYNVNSGKWGQRDFDWPSDSVNGLGCAEWGWSLDEGVLGTDFPTQGVHAGGVTDKKILQLDRTTTGPGGAGSNIAFLLHRDDLDFGDRNRRKIIKRVWPIVTGDGTGITLTVRTRDHPNEAQNIFTWGSFDPQTDTFMTGEDDPPVERQRASGKLIGFRWTGGNSSATEYKFWGFDVEWEFDGEW